MQTYTFKKVIQNKKTLAASALAFVMFFAGAWVTFDISESVVFDTIGLVQAAPGCGSCGLQDKQNGPEPGWTEIVGGGGGGFGGGGSNQPPVCKLFVSDTYFGVGNTTLPGPGNVTLTWQIGQSHSALTPANLAKATFTINNGVGPGEVPASSSIFKSKVVHVTDTTTFVGTVTNIHGTGTCSTTVTITTTPPPKPICTLTIDPNSIYTGGNATLSWTSQHATSGSVNQGVGAVSPVAGGSTTISPTSSKTYTATFTGPGGTTTCSDSITVTPPSSDPICYLDVDPSHVSSGGISTLTWSTINGTSFEIDQGIGTVTPTAGGSVDTDPLSNTTTFTGTVHGSGGKTATCSTTVTVTPPGSPICTLDADPTSVDVGEISELTWTTSNATSFEIDQGIGTVTPTAGGSVDTDPLSSTTTFTGTARDTHGNTAQCQATVTVNIPPHTPICALSIDKSKINSGESATLSWTSANVTSGFINKGVGTTSPVSGGSTTIFPSDSTTYTGTFTGPYGDVTCSASITVEKGGGGCIGNCGGGLNPPTTILFKKPGDQPLAFVSLSQIPYTGFEAGPVLATIFWLAVTVWSFGIAYVLAGRGSMRYIMNQFFNTAPAFVYRALDRKQEVRYEDSTYEAYNAEDEYFNQSVTAVDEPTVSTPVANPTSQGLTPHVLHQPAGEKETPNHDVIDGIPHIADVLESRANAAGVLLSPEALQSAEGLADSREEILKIFGAVIDQAVRTLPREDGWILISSDTLQKLIRETSESGVSVSKTQFSGEVHAPQATEAVSESIVTRLTGDILSGNRDTAFALLKQLEHEHVDARTIINGVAYALDDLYRARSTHTAAKDLALAEKAKLIPNEKLAELVEVFTNAFDVQYNSAFTAFKISLAQAFDVRA